MKTSDPVFPIGVVAKRTGLAVSAIRFYEEQGLVQSTRAKSGHRRFQRSTIRRLSFIRICQQLGYTLDEIRTQLDVLPGKRTPSESDWEKLAAGFADDIAQRIAGLQLLQAKLDECIGCGCLSLGKCRLYNADDGASGLGVGPRYLLGNTPADI